jgi:PAS domain S-box-containing protein
LNRTWEQLRRWRHTRVSGPIRATLLTVIVALLLIDDHGGRQLQMGALILAGVWVCYELFAVVDWSTRTDAAPDARLQLANMAQWLDHAPVPMYLKDRAARYVAVNSAWRALTGLSLEVVVGRTHSEIPYLPADDRFADFHHQVVNGQRRQVEFTATMPRAADTPTTMVITKRVLTGADGQPIGVIGSLIDIGGQLSSAKQIREQKERLDLVLEASQSGIFDLHLPHGPSYVSPRLCAMLGYADHWQPRLQDSDDWVHPEDLERTRAIFRRHLRRNADRCEVEYRHVRADGTYIPVEVHAIASFDEHGRAIRFTGSIMNVETKHRALREAALQRSYLVDLIEASPNPIFMKSIDGTWEVVNQAWEQLAGKSRREVIGLKSRDFQRPDIAAVNESQDAELLASPLQFSQRRMPFRRDDGRVFDTIVTKRILHSAEGKPMHIIGVITDISMLADLKRQLSEQSARLDIVVEASQHGIWDRNLDTGEFYCSQRFREILGYSPDDDMQNYNMGPDLHPDDRDRVLQARDAYLSGEVERFDVEFRRFRPDGQCIWIRSRGLIIEDELGRRSVGSIIDTTADRMREAELREATSQAHAAVQAKAAFLSTMSHEIRTPLNGVLGASNLLATTPLNEEQRRFVESIQVSGDALLALISDILDFSRIESGRIELDVRPIELARLIDSTFEIVGVHARQKGLELWAEFAPNIPLSVKTDEGRLRQILLNLVGNALKFTSRGFVRVRVSSSEAGKPNHCRLRFSVEDTGIGVLPEHRPHLFEAFRQGDASVNRKFGGSGLGLAICKRLANLMGGDVWLMETDQPINGGLLGAVFCCEVEVEAAAPEEAPVLPLAAISGRSVLLMQFQPEVRTYYSQLFSDWGMQVEAVADTRSAVQRLREAPFDVVVTDIELGEMGSASLVAYLTNEVTRKVPVVALSHLSASDYLATTGAMASFDAFVLKPASRSQVYDGLHRVLVSASLGLNDAEYDIETVYHVDPTRKSVLVVEDNAINQMIAREMLKRLGYACDVVRDGYAALRTIGEHPYTVVLMDVQMPGLDGKDTTRQLVATYPEAERPVIIALTAHALAGDREDCLAAGMDDYLAKPLNPERLASALQRAFDLFAARRRRAPAELPDLVRIAASPPRAPTNAMPLLASVPILDESQLRDLTELKESGDDSPLLPRLLLRLSERLDVAIEGLRTSLPTMDANTLKTLAQDAHDLRGLSATLGAARLAGHWQDIERMARAEDRDGLATAVEPLAATAAQSRAALQDWIAREMTAASMQPSGHALAPLQVTNTGSNQGAETFT